MEMQDLEEFREALELMEVPDLTLPDTGRPSAAFRQLVLIPFVCPLPCHPGSKRTSVVCVPYYMLVCEITCLS